MNLSAEDQAVTGNPTERLVQEAVWFEMNQYEEPILTSDQVVAWLVGTEGITAREARLRVLASIADGEVGADLDDHGGTVLGLDAVTNARIWRRYLYFDGHKEGRNDFAPHLPEECGTVASAVFGHTLANDGDLPDWDDLVAAVLATLRANGDVPDPTVRTAEHATLNALDAGAIVAVGPVFDIGDPTTWQEAVA